MKVLVLGAMLISSVVWGQKSPTGTPFTGTREFNFSGGGACCNVSITIDKKGNCKIYAGMHGSLQYSGKFRPIMNGYKIYKKNGSVYAAMVNPKGKIDNDCTDYEGNTIPCVFKLEKF